MIYCVEDDAGIRELMIYTLQASDLQAKGLQDADAKVADMLRRSKKPVVLVVNKVDSFEKFMPDVY